MRTRDTTIVIGHLMMRSCRLIPQNLPSRATHSGSWFICVERFHEIHRNGGENADLNPPFTIYSFIRLYRAASVWTAGLGLGHQHKRREAGESCAGTECDALRPPT